MASILKTFRISKNFGALQAVADVTMEVVQGTVHGIIGPNGAGKTTLLNLLTGFIKPSAGRIYFKERDITNYGPHKISKIGIGRSFQITNVFSELSVLENVRIAAQSRTPLSYRFFADSDKLSRLEDEAISVLEKVGLAGRASLPAKHLPHGEKKILDVAIALATKPSLLLLDEPTAGLVGDEVTRIADLIRSIANEVTVVLVEHNVDVVLSICDLVTVLHYGSVIAEGGPKEIRTNKKVQEVYLGESQC